MSAEPVLRWAAAEDWPAAWSMQREAFRPLVEATHGGWTEALVRGCEEGWSAAHTRMVSVDGRDVGWVCVEHHPTHDFLDTIVVEPSAAGRGLGTRLLGLLIAEARERGVPLWLSVWKENRARGWYARLGFREHPRDDRRVYQVFPPDTEGTAPPGG